MGYWPYVLELFGFNRVGGGLAAPLLPVYVALRVTASPCLPAELTVGFRHMAFPSFNHGRVGRLIGPAMIAIPAPALTGVPVLVLVICVAAFAAVPTSRKVEVLISSRK